MKTCKLHIVCGCFVGLFGAFEHSANASPLLQTAQSIGDNAGAQGVVSGPGAASSYFNPALLTEADEDVLLGFALISEQVGVTLDGRRGGDVPLAIGGRDVVTPDGTPIPNEVVPTQWLSQGCPAGSKAGQCPAPGFPARPRQAAGSSGKTRTYLTLGLVKHLVKDRLSIGLYGMFPVSSFTTAQAFYPDSREALFSNSLHPEMYGDRLTAISIVLGAGFKVLPNLSLGAGLSLGLTNTAASATYVRNATDYSTLLLDNSVNTQVNLSPLFGVRWAPMKWLKIGGSVHAPESFEVDTTIDATLPSGTESKGTVTNVFDWTPWMVDVGTEADVLERGKYTMSVDASIKYAFWSSYVDRQNQSPSIYGPGLGFHDTLSGALGVRHKYANARGFIDLTYAPSPVPEQVGESNYVDNDKVGLMAGADIALKLGPTKLRPGAQFFVNRLIYRHNTKDDARMTDQVPDDSIYGSTHDPVLGAKGLQTNNPGWPGFASQGWIWGGAITLEVPL